MKKYIISILITPVFLLGIPLAINQVSAQNMSIRDFINLLVSVGVITPEKMPAVNAYLASIETPEVISSENLGLVLEKDPYINQNYGFKINIPKSWKITNLSRGGEILYVVSEPMLTYTSGLSIMFIPISSEDVSKISNETFQNNLLKILSAVITKNGSKITSTNRVSSSVININVKSSEADSIQSTGTASVIFNENGIYFLISSISDLDKQTNIQHLLSKSSDTFKIFPITVSGSKTKLSLATNDAKTHSSENFKYSIQYPSNWDWQFTVGTSDYSETLAFIYQNQILNGPTKTATITFFTRKGNPNDNLDDDINMILSSYDKKTVVTRNVQLLPTNMPSDVKAEVIQTEQFEPYADGTRRATTNLYLFAIRGDHHYRFNFKADSEDFDSIYPLAVNIMRTIRFK
jgi:hypothetical protein